MRLNDLIKIVSEAYPESYIADFYWDFGTSRPKNNPTGGDTLALFIAREIADTFQDDMGDAGQLREAIIAMTSAQNQLGDICTELEKQLCNVRHVKKEQ